MYDPFVSHVLELENYEHNQYGQHPFSSSTNDQRHMSSCFTGVFTVSGIIDSFVYHGQRAITKKRELGKFT
ncbi:unnamed protein product [Triticum turgidum subsp. durum]|uniref:Uncharacterized protein n=2 Tax=Triticinae TaxID=1648030 RepID=A0A9R1PTG9_TRITD|nr:unnamed protein product [Triticum turgidum subsp. durum]